MFDCKCSPLLALPIIRMQNIDRLALVSKVLLDQHFLDLRNEVESLKLEHFWTKHHGGKFSKAIQCANKYGPACMCCDCTLSGRCNMQNFFPNAQHQPGGRLCLFMPWFDKRAARCGLTIGIANEEARVKDVAIVGFQDELYNQDFNLLFIQHEIQNKHEGPKSKYPKQKRFEF